MRRPAAPLCAALLLVACGETAEPARDASSVDAKAPSDVGLDAPLDAALDAPDAPLDVAKDVVTSLPDGQVCPAGQRVCDGRCVDVAWDVAHCGACGRPCGAGLACSRGRCQATCDASRITCTVGGSLRCVDATSDALNCGDCGRACAAGEVCVESRCACPAASRLCGGRCTDILSDPGNCSGCGVACPPVLNGRATCERGGCGVECFTGYHRCGSRCVDDRAVETCGSMCIPCQPVTNGVATCDGVACGVTCAAGYHLCGGACVSNASLASCGASCTACPVPTGGTASCVAGACVANCATGFHACAGACVSNTALASCGTTCTPCATVAGAAATCDGRACGFACAAGLGNCDADASNGCETDLRVTAAHCGACGRPCAAVAGARPSCVAAACGFVCEAGFADCDRNPANGCETSTRWSAANCGACARTCATGEVCAMGVCRAPGVAWTRRFGDTSDDGAHAVASDAMGNAVVAGRLSGPTRVGVDTLAGAGRTDAFVVSMRADNSLRWARSYGGATLDAAHGVALDRDGNVYVAGTFTGSAELGMGVVASRGDTDAFVISLTPEGVVRWVRTLGSDGADAAYGVATDAMGVYVTGSVRGTVDFGGGATAGGASPDPFVLALGLDGAFRWSRRFGAVSPRTGSGAGYGVATGADGAVVVTGYFQGAPTFGADLLVSAGNFDLFVVSLTSAGEQRWSRRYGGASVDWAQAVTLDASNNLYVTGYYQGTADLGGGGLTAPSGTDGFVASYTIAGVHRWSRRFGGATGVFGTATGYGVTVDALGNVVVAGSFSGNVDFGGGLRASAGRLDAFLASYTGAGVPRWSRRFGADGDDELRGVASDASSAVFAAGVFEGGVDFGTGAVTSAGAADAVVIQMVQ